MAGMTIYEVCANEIGDEHHVYKPTLAEARTAAREHVAFAPDTIAAIYRIRTKPLSRRVLCCALGDGTTLPWQTSCELVESIKGAEA